MAICFTNQSYDKMVSVRPRTSFVTFVTPELRLEIISMFLTVSWPLYQPYHFSNRTRERKMGMAISKILPYVSIILKLGKITKKACICGSCAIFTRLDQMASENKINGCERL